MKLQKVIVIPKIPDKIVGLKEIANNLWWSWNADAIKLFSTIDPDGWEKVNHNPIKFLNTVDEEKLIKASENDRYMTNYNMVINKFDRYMTNIHTWIKDTYREYKDAQIAYFCAEYGLSESFPNYSGGLGILAGDYLKSASDLGINMVAVGLLYKTGYFIQRINEYGEQVHLYEENDFSDFPLSIVKDKEENRILIEVYMADKTLYAQAWELKVGINKLYLLDMDIDENPPEYRKISYTLYDSGPDIRIKQEILLGIGGVKLLETLNLNIATWHMNEGHSAFLIIERILGEMKRHKINFYEAFEAIKSNTVFTTHTPVPAGNDVFFQDTIELFLDFYISRLGISKKEFFNLATIYPEEKVFSMTVFALKTSSYSNGVSKLHQEVSKKMWHGIWNKLPYDEIPIDYVTNGVHTMTWQADEISRLVGANTEELNRTSVDSASVWEAVDDVPDELLWKKHQDLKRNLFKEIAKNDVKLDPNVLTIGFARRFATYKRADLLFRDLERIQKIVNYKETPIQIIFAGKAHPADAPGQSIIRKIVELSKMEGFKNKMILLENYDMGIAKKLVQGVDIWMNTPRRPYEASGTSGQKAAINGVINFSVLDGWWPEAYNKTNGFAIGTYEDFESEETQDDFDAHSLYHILENEILPMYYEKNKAGYSERWVRYMKNSIKSITPQFNMHRQLKEYFAKFYIECIQNKNLFYSEDFEVARYVSKWKEKVTRSWNNIRFVNEISTAKQKNTLGDEIRLSTIVNLESLSEEDVRVEAYIGELNDKEEVVNYRIIPMKAKEIVSKNTYQYEANIRLDTAGVYGLNTRIVPNSKFAKDTDLGLIKWSK